MPIHTVKLERMLVEQSCIDVEADSPDEAQRIAMTRADDGMVCWTRVALDVLAEAEPLKIRKEN
jgi:predicted GNAT family N-acyltransferase